jgi:SnoaL-like domain
MTRTPEILERMLATWNETDLARIPDHVRAVFSEDVVFIDPANSILGHESFISMVREFRTKFPDAVCSRASGVDSHHGLHRYHWEIHRGEELLLPGFDVAEINGDGLVSRVQGFFGPIPPGDDGKNRGDA